ncbi:MAG TPA: ATP-dependent RecD-like DNA helicase [Clostridia bacterium]|jgi:exodeoxyribonuclease V alpha subunit|nr:ATP-dependent RecD-like DNA helicase [Clostridia bacterium]
MTIRGTIEQVIFQNLDTGYTVLALYNDTDGYFFARGNVPQVVEGEVVELTGEFEHTTKYGEQFAFTACEFIAPGNREAIISFLSSGLFQGIGEVTANKIVDALGDETLTKLDEPGALNNIRGIGEKKANTIQNSYRAQKQVRENLFFLQSHGLTINKATKVCERYGDKTREVIESNPYSLVKDIEGIGFKTADKIAEELGIDSQSPFRIEAAINYAINDFLQLDGHTCISPDVAIDKTFKLLENVDKDLIKTTLRDLIDKKELIYIPESPDFPEIKGDRIALRMHFLTERSIAYRTIKLLKNVKKVNTDISHMIAEYEIENKLLFHETQKKAIATAISEGFTVITGGPGTGKTTIIKCIIHIRERLGFSVGLAAPTGRASKRLEEATGYSSKTIHRLLGVKMTSAGMVYEFNEQNPLKFDTVILDEISMADIYIFNALLKAMKSGANIILVGDKDQLPSVAVGNVLGDLIGSGILPVTYLTEIYRQEQGSLIVQNAHRINRGEMPILDNNSKDFYFIEARDEQDNLDTVVSLIMNRLPTYYGVDSRDIQVLSPSKKGLVGVDALNIKLQTAINGGNINRGSFETNKTKYALGDKVMQTVNNYNLPWEKRDPLHPLSIITESEEGVYNGELGFITSIKHGVVEVTFEDGKIVEYNPWEVNNNLMLAYAITVHKSQGCEFENVILSISGSHLLMTRNLLYTAITRAKGMVVIVGSIDALRRMVNNNRVARRETFLKKLLLEADSESSTGKSQEDLIREQIKLFSAKKSESQEDLDELDNDFFNTFDDDDEDD